MVNEKIYIHFKYKRYMLIDNGFQNNIDNNDELLLLNKLTVIRNDVKLKII